jgi:hypothetical protein
VSKKLREDIFAKSIGVFDNEKCFTLTPGNDFRKVWILNNRVSTSRIVYSFLINNEGEFFCYFGISYFAIFV